MIFVNPLNAFSNPYIIIKNERFVSFTTALGMQLLASALARGFMVFNH